MRLAWFLFLNIYVCIPICSMNYFFGQCMNMFFGLVLNMYVFFSLSFLLHDFSCMHFANPPPITFLMAPLLKIITLTVYCIFFQSISTSSTQDTVDLKHQPHVHLVSTFVNYFRRCSIAMLIFFLLTEWPVASPVQEMGFIFFSGEGRGGGGYFWEVIVGEPRPPHLIFTLFQSNIYCWFSVSRHPK